MWQKKFERNEPLDTRVYARAAASIVGLDRLKPSAIEAIAGRKSKPMPELQLEYSRNMPAAAIEEAPATMRRQRRKSVYWDR